MGTPLLSVSVVITAVRLPASTGSVEKVIVNAVALAAVTLPTAESLNTTLSLALLGSKPNPLMVMVEALAARFAVF